MTRRIPIAIAGVGNCASALLQGIEHYRRLPPGADEAWGLLHLELGGWRPEHVEVVAAFDVDRRKVGRPLHEAAFAAPNCTRVIADEIAKSDVVVQMGPLLDGVAPHMMDYDEARSFVTTRGGRLLTSEEWDAAARTPNFSATDGVLEWVDSPGDRKVTRQRGVNEIRADAKHRDVTFRMARDP